jgi:lipopolysaccharide transport system ATP-binding protein
MSETLVTVENVSKKFSRRLKHALWYGVQDLCAELAGRSNGRKDLRPEEFWAVKDISFELKRGECLGLIGPNGAGKSTLLKILNGLVKPDRGKVTVRGRVGALIELGTGFNPLLTGRENIYVNGAILGFSKKEIAKKFDAIVDFAELAEFIDTPVQSYSSGMKVRLGFAIAAQMEPDVLLLDEILAVGDVGFRAKCFNAMFSILKNAAVIFVSHVMPQIGRICTDILVMDQGHGIYQGNSVPEGIQHYYSKFSIGKGIIAGNGRAKIHKIEFQTKNKRNIHELSYLDDLCIHVGVTIDSSVKNPTISFGFLNMEQQIVAACHSLFNKVSIVNTGKPLDIQVKLPRMNLNPGIYALTVTVTDEARKEILTQHYAAKQLRVTGSFVGWSPILLQGEWSALDAPETNRALFSKQA